MDRHCIIGLGSGRCGTKSLAKLLCLPHEAVPLPWNHNERLYRLALSRISEVFGDVGCYWLNYVERLLFDRPDTKFICLKRNKEKTIRSWEKRLVGCQRFGLYVMYLDHDKQIHVPPMFPDYGRTPISEAAGHYWDEYYERAEKLAEKHPNHFRIFWMDRVLNDRRAQRQMMKFAGMPRQKFAPAHINRGSEVDPEIANVIREYVEHAVREHPVHYGQSLVIRPQTGTRLSKLAVKTGLSASEGDDINVTFSSVGNMLVGGEPMELFHGAP